MKYPRYLLIILTLFFGAACSEDKLDEIDTNPNNPEDVPLQLVLPVTQASLAYEVVAGDLALYLSVWVQHHTGVHAQLHSADRFIYTAAIGNNDWNSAYATTLKNLDYIITEGTEQEAWHYVGIAQVLQAQTFAVLTDNFGQIPYTEALQGSAVTQPKYDTQQSIYLDATTGLIASLDVAIANLEKTSFSPGNADLIYGGDASKWIKAAWGLKARFMTRVSGQNPAYSADAIIAAVGNSFTSAADGFIFNAFASGATNENPFFQEANDRAHFAVSQSLFDLMASNNDPRVEWFFDDGAASVPAPNGVAELDQAGALYTKAYGYIDADDPVEFLTYDQLKFIEAEAQLKKGSNVAAYDAYLAGITAAMNRVDSKGGVSLSTAEINAYMNQDEIRVGAGNLTLEHIWKQNYIGFFPFQATEAFAEWRRTGYPALVNPNGNIPQRVIYTQREIDTNLANVPNATVSPTNGVWWADGTDD